MNKFVIVVVLLFVGAISVSTVNPSSELLAFGNFLKKYNKVYNSAEEYEQRFENFKASLARSAEKDRKSPKADYGITKFSDMSTEEFQNTILMKKPIIPNDKPRTNVMVPKVSAKAVPSFLDWRERGAVTPVKDQEQCGSCWAFSATENIESMWILAGKATNTTLNLSPQQIVDCDTSDSGCEGGDTTTAFAYVIGAGGLESISNYPYTGEDGNCNFQAGDVVAKITNWQYATDTYSETEIQQNLVSWGPLSICVDASNWQDYEGGVMTWEECAWINELDHCVELVGYNATNTDNSYWIVRNSWNTNWGIEGYIYLEMWEDTCGLAYEATSAIVSSLL